MEQGDGDHRIEDSHDQRRRHVESDHLRKQCPRQHPVEKLVKEIKEEIKIKHNTHRERSEREVLVLVCGAVSSPIHVASDKIII